MHVTIVIKRLWIRLERVPSRSFITITYPSSKFSSVAAHLLAVILILIAAFGTFVQVAHRQEREQLYLAHPPGTIACAVSVGASTQLGQLLAREPDLEGSMQNKKFGMNTQTMQIMMNDEPGYKEATVDRLSRRKSLFSPFMPTRQSVVPTETGELKR